MTTATVLLPPTGATTTRAMIPAPSRSGSRIASCSRRPTRGSRPRSHPGRTKRCSRRCFPFRPGVLAISGSWTDASRGRAGSRRVARTNQNARTTAIVTPVTSATTGNASQAAPAMPNATMTSSAMAKRRATWPPASAWMVRRLCVRAMATSATGSRPATRTLTRATAVHRSTATTTTCAPRTPAMRRTAARTRPWLTVHPVVTTRSARAAPAWPSHVTKTPTAMTICSAPAWRPV